VIRPHGRSMEPLVSSGAEVFLEPVQIEDLEVRDIVLCRVAGNVYLHLVKALDQNRVLIGNNQGRINGWAHAVYGRAYEIRNG